jgi:alpha-galactosidase
VQSKPFLPATAALAILLVGCTTIETPGLPYNGLAITPPMGWNSWNYFKNMIDDQIVRSVADAMASSGMRDAGYIYVNIDDTWQGARDAQGNLTGNQRFPDMKALADYVHSKGLKFGLYSSPGPLTCSGYPGSYGHEEQDANTFANWGVDYLKYDWCSGSSVYSINGGFQLAYEKMGIALQATGRPIVYSISNQGSQGVDNWGAEVGANLWRTTSDISDSWVSMMGNIEDQVSAARYAGPGHWNDPDMLEIGNGGMTEDEYRTNMSLWALAAAPLLAGNDVRAMSASTKLILLNAEVIMIDQDPLGKQASRVSNGILQTWIKPLADGSVAVGVVNLGSFATQATVNAEDLGLAGTPAGARDLWAHRDVAFSGDTYTATIPSHGVLLLKVSSN